MNNWFRRNSIHLAISGIFLAICFFYFTPAFEGKALGQSDVVGAQSTQTEINAYKAKDTTILWTNQIFGGMPAFQIWAPYPNNITTWIVKGVSAVFPYPIFTVLLLLLGTYFLLCVLKVNPWLAAAGALAFTFSSYNIILLVAGHTNQAFAIAFFAPLVAAVILTLRGKYWLGASLTALFLAVEIRANHIQMTYYLLLAMLILLGIELYHAIKSKAIPSFLKAMGFIGVAIVIGLAVNASLLWSTYDYGKDTIRGKSNLTQHTTEPSDGLDRQYAYAYSQGVTESFTFLVPNASGGGSITQNSDPNSETAKVFINKGASEDQAVNNVRQISGFPGLSLYWGEKGGTYGPFYFGAVICFLFIFGLLIVKNRLKWWLLATVVLTMLLSFGGNWPYVSDLFFNYFPLYNKFRTVESILAITGLCFPILAVLALQEVTVNTDKVAIWKNLKIAFYITGGILLVLIVMPGILLSFKPNEQTSGITALTQAMKGDAATAESVGNALIRDRTSLEQADAIRSLVFVAIAFGLLWAFIKQKISVTALSISFLALILVDLWQIDKRYLADANFADKQDSVLPPLRQVDQIILQDHDADYRVVDLSQTAKYDLLTPFYHKSIWGYSAARLKRFDEIIDNQFSKNINIAVLSMLNTRYIIVQDPKTQALSVQKNPDACGNAWFVKTVKYVNNADDEMQAITAFSPKDEVVIDKQFMQLVNKSTTMPADTAATIKLTNYNPDHMVYQSNSSVAGIGVFSEIYYNRGWKMLIDGKESPYFRADYLLRAASIPAGKHKIEFIFHPASYYTGEDISFAGSILLVMALSGATYLEISKKKAKVAS